MMRKTGIGPTKDQRILGTKISRKVTILSEGNDEGRYSQCDDSFDWIPLLQFVERNDIL